MTHNFDIPAIMRELPIDERGYPIPYFVPIVNGKADFRYQDAKKKDACMKYGKCSICGKKLFKDSYWFISGPMGLQNRVASDAPMHEDCARFSLMACPHILLQKADRRSEDITHVQAISRNKPPYIYLIKADKYKLIDGVHIRFRTVMAEQYEYVENKLVKSKIQPA